MSTDRRARAATLCRQLTADVEKVAPRGIGRWPVAWEIVSFPSDSFLDLLNEWEATGAPELQPRIREAYDAVLDAWREAAHRYTGRPRESVTA